ncbi:MAG: VWA domain-containing protein [Planctomycetota bacterium]|jgi:hypothetical protein
MRVLLLIVCLGLVLASAQEQQTCPKCEKEVKASAKFCTGCGEKLKDAEPKKPAEKPDTPLGADEDSDKVKKTTGKGLAGVGLEVEQVNRAIDRGAAYIAKYYHENDLLNEEDYLGAYALIHTKQYRKDARLREMIFRKLRKTDWLKSSSRGYIAGVRALGLEATRDAELQAMTWECAQYLVDAQGPEGTWDYAVDVDLGVERKDEDGMPAIFVSGGEPLEEADKPKGRKIVRRKKWEEGDDGDNSVTQFAILGLHAAARCGHEIPAVTWERCLKTMKERHEKELGGWGYGIGETTGSMTCAGVCTIALCRHYLGKGKPLEDEHLQKGLAWLGKNFTVEKNPPEEDWHLYYMYSLERTGVFCATEFFGDHEWYAQGAKWFVENQAENGSWSGRRESEILGTGFALLFLTRATAPVGKDRKRGGKGVLDTQQLMDDTNFLFIVDASGSMREEMGEKTKFDVARAVIETAIRKLPEGAHVGLRVYGHRHRANKKEADTDSELLIPIAPMKRAEFLATLKALKCRGKTPLTHSLQEAANDVWEVPSEVELTVVLLTDGKESTRKAKPEEAAAALAERREGLKLHVVGFDIEEEEKGQLEAIAKAGKGKYYHARDPDELMESFIIAVVGNAPYRILDRDGKEVVKGEIGDEHRLPEGKYTFVLTVKGKEHRKAFWINTEETTQVTVRTSELK